MPIFNKNSTVSFRTRFKIAFYYGFLLWIFLPAVAIVVFLEPLSLGNITNNVNSFNTVNNSFGDGGRGELGRLATESAKRQNIPPALLHSLITHESAWNPNALSPKGARGLGQIMPNTAKSYCGIIDLDKLFDSELNTECAAYVLAIELKYWMARTLTDEEAIKFSLASYNAGRNAVINRNALRSFPETRSYVARVYRDYVGGSR